MIQPLGEHSGMTATYHRVKQVFHWPNLKKDIEGYIEKCPVCQITKTEHVSYPGLLEPIELSDMAWTHLTMDFIEGLPKSRSKDVILVVVDRFTKYAHFMALSHPYTVQQVVQLFMEHVFKLHGMPISIISDQDRIFTSKLVQEIFKAMKVTLKYSTAHHPQTDGRNKRVNQSLESYLRSMVFLEPKDWFTWLPLAEWWYNTSYHTALRISPFQALYGYPPPLVGEMALPCNISEEARITVEQKEMMNERLKRNLHIAQERMKHYADNRRSEREFQVGEMVYLKMQPYRQNAFGLRGSLKLRSKYYGPFRIMERVGKVAYKLQLPQDAAIHPVFHVSQLKHCGNHAVPLPGLPLVGPDGKVKTEPESVLDRRIIPRRGEAVAQWLIKWVNLSVEDATWEDVPFVTQTFKEFKP
uniref:Uncharacterized protein n=1 Tax=Arundo donax TaxID=35708 RepID=A0A0A9TKS5_ARUDO